MDNILNISLIAQSLRVNFTPLYSRANTGKTVPPNLLAIFLLATVFQSIDGSIHAY